VESPRVLTNANQLLKFDIKPKYALHVASAVEGEADYFLTTDDKLLSRINRSNIIEILNLILIRKNRQPKYIPFKNKT
jgi:predicted nucleic acid-binding protein